MPIGPDGRKDSIEITTAMLLDNNLQTLEHIDIRVWINHPRRGDVMVDLVSPDGIKSDLAETRVDDEAKTGFPGWRFMIQTIKHWYVLYASIFDLLCDAGVKILSGTGLLKPLKRISERTVPSWDGTWFWFCLHLPRCSISVFLETTDVPITARRVLAANEIHMDPVGRPDSCT